MNANEIYAAILKILPNANIEADELSEEIIIYTGLVETAEGTLEDPRARS